MVGAVVVRGVPEPAGERFSQCERGGVGGFVDGCGPGDVGVRSDQERVGWSVIGCRAEHVDAIPSVSGGLAEVCSVGEVEEDRPRGVHEFRDARCAPVVAQGKVGCEGADQGVVVVAG